MPSATQESTELIDVLDSQGNPAGEVVTRRELYEKMLSSNIVHIIVLNSEGKHVFQKRAKIEALESPEEIFHPETQFILREVYGLRV